MLLNHKVQFSAVCSPQRQVSEISRRPNSDAGFFPVEEGPLVRPEQQQQNPPASTGLFVNPLGNKQNQQPASTDSLDNPAGTNNSNRTEYVRSSLFGAPPTSQISRKKTGISERLFKPVINTPQPVNRHLELRGTVNKSAPAQATLPAVATHLTGCEPPNNDEPNVFCCVAVLYRRGLSKESR